MQQYALDAHKRRVIQLVGHESRDGDGRERHHGKVAALQEGGRLGDLDPVPSGVGDKVGKDVGFPGVLGVAVGVHPVAVGQRNCGARGDGEDTGDVGDKGECFDVEAVERLLRVAELELDEEDGFLCVCLSIHVHD